MNIFKALSYGNGKISESNVTSFMSYLINSNNELNNSFFMLFIHLIDSVIADEKIADEKKICEILDIDTKKSIREQINTFSRKYSVSAISEFRIKKDGRTKIPDILVTITDKDINKDNESVAYFLIENKINASALDKNQLKNQLEFFKSSEDYVKDKPVYSIFITPDGDDFKEFWNNNCEKSGCMLWLKWINFEAPPKSVEAKLRKLIECEHNAEIDTIDLNTQYIIKSFIDYVATKYFKVDKSRTNNYSCDNLNVIEEATAEVDDKKYLIRRFNNNFIRLFDENGNLMDVRGKVKPILHKINNKYKFGLKETLTDTTQTFGRKVIRELNNKR